MKHILFIFLIFSLISCNEGYNYFSRETEYYDFKENWVEPENYSFELHYSTSTDSFNYDSYNYDLNKSFAGNYSVKIEKINNNVKIYLSNYYYESTKEEIFEKEIPKDDFISYVGEENYIESISDAIEKFDTYRTNLLEIDKKNDHIIGFLQDPISTNLDNYYYFGASTYENKLFTIKNPHAEPINFFSINIDHYKFL